MIWPFSIIQSHVRGTVSVLTTCGRHRTCRRLQVCVFCDYVEHVSYWKVCWACCLSVEHSYNTFPFHLLFFQYWSYLLCPFFSVVYSILSTSLQFSKLFFFSCFVCVQYSLPCCTCYYKWHSLCISLKLSFWCALPLQNFLNGRNLFIVKPLFRSCIYGCTCARIFIQSACSSFSHVNIKCFIVSLFLIFISWFCIITCVATRKFGFSGDVSSNASISLS